jgi:ATP-binding cassette subfamily B protein
MILISSRLTLYALIPLPLLVLVVTYFGSLINRRFERVQAGFARLTEKVRETLAGIRVIKCFVQERGEDQNFKELSKDYLERNMGLVRIWGMFFPLANLLGFLALALVLWLGGEMVIFNRITMGDFVAFNTYLGILIWPMAAIGQAINLFQRGAASMGRLNRIFEAEPEVKSPMRPRILKRIGGEVKFCNLTFKYPGANRPALKDINLVVRPGEIVGVLGRVGSGKSTLAELLLRLYDPPRETIFIDGCDIRKLSLEDLRGLIAYVPQEGFLFSDTIRENLCFGKLDASDEELREAARRAELESEILEFPDNYETVLGERGGTVSGGQRQRLELARALILNRPILILDDAFSSVDTDTESRILEGIRPMLARRTVLIIAHRISTIRYAHRVVVMDGGRIVEEGTHRELLKRGGLYTRIYQIQKLRARIEVS